MLHPGAGRTRPWWRRRPAAGLASAAAAAAVVLGVLWGPSPLEQVEESLCDRYRSDAPTGLPPALGCGGPEDGLLGVAASPVSELRNVLDADPRKDDPEWVSARTLVALLERNPDDVIHLLEGRDDWLDANPRLRSDYASALLLKDDLEGARAQLRRAVRSAPDDPLLQRNLARLESGGAYPE